MALFRYRDVPGMVGRVGTALGEGGINILSAAVGYEAGADGEAVMIVTTDQLVPSEIIAGIAASDGFRAGRAISVCT